MSEKSKGATQDPSGQNGGRRRGSGEEIMEITGRR